MRNLLVICLFLILVSACKETNSDVGRYQVFITNGVVWRLDTISGNTIVVDSNKSDRPQQLVVGNVYLFEDGKLMKYIGSGKFKSAHTVSRWIEK